MKTPPIDIDHIYTELKSANYIIDRVPTKDDTEQLLLNAIDSFLGTIKANDTVLVYYAGHGVDIDGDNELVPADAPSPSEVVGYEILKSRLISFHDMMQDVEDRDPAVDIWIIDACRTNPYSLGLRGGAGAGLSAQETVTGRYVMYSADYNQAAIDSLPTDQSGTQLGSPFSRVFISFFTKDQFKDIDLYRRDVLTALRTLVTPQVQTPVAENGMNGEWCISGCSDAPREIALTSSAPEVDRLTTQFPNKATESATSLNYIPTEKASGVSIGSQFNNIVTPVLSAVADSRGSVFLGKKSAADCKVSEISDLFPFGCTTLRGIESHFTNGAGNLTTGLIGSSITATTEVNVRRGLPHSGPDGTRYGCRVATMETGESVKLAATVALTYSGDTYYWGIIDGPATTCSPTIYIQYNSLNAINAHTSDYLAGLRQSLISAGYNVPAIEQQAYIKNTTNSLYYFSADQDINADAILEKVNHYASEHGEVSISKSPEYNFETSHADGDMSLQLFFSS